MAEQKYTYTVLNQIYIPLCSQLSAMSTQMDANTLHPCLDITKDSLVVCLQFVVVFYLILF